MRICKGLIFTLLLVALVGCNSGVPPGSHTATALTPVCVIDRLLPEAIGARSSTQLLLLKSYPETVFVTGASVRVVGEEGLDPQKAANLMSAADLQWVNPARHGELMGQKGTVNPVLFAFCPGVTEVRLPKGWGIPLRSNEALSLTVQWKNEDVYLKPTSVQLEATVEFSSGPPLHPLRSVMTTGLCLVEGEQPYFNVPQPTTLEHGPGCLKGRMIPELPMNPDSLGRHFQGYWRSAMGDQTNCTLVDQELARPLVVRAIAPNFATGLTDFELRRRGEKAPLYKFDPQRPVMAIDEGLALNGKDHYELSCTYHNFFKVERIVWAFLQLYVEDHEVLSGGTADK